MKCPLHRPLEFAARGDWKLVAALWLVVSLLGAVQAWGGVFDLDGRYRADFQELETSLLSTSHLQQQLDLGVEDYLFGANMLRLNVTTQRYSDVSRGLSDTTHRLRFSLTGNTYNLVGIYSPKGGSGYGLDQQGDQTEDVQLTWQYTVPRFPSVRASYRRNESFAFTGASVSRSKERSVEMGHKIGFVEMTGLWRRIDHDGASMFRGRGQEHIMGRLSARRELTRGLSADMALDIQDAETQIAGRSSRDSRTRNFRAGVVWSRRRDLKAYFNVLDRNTTGVSDGVEVNGLNREVSGRISWQPKTSLKMDLRRDVRDVKQGTADTHSDILRYQGSLHGRVRSRVRGRLNVIFNHAFSTRNLAAPADNADLTFDAGLFRKTTMRTTVSISRRHGDTTTLIGRYGVQRYVDLRTRLTRKIEVNFTWRANLNADKIFLNKSTNTGTSLGLVYSGSRGMSASGSYRRSVETAREGRVGNSLTGNIHFTLSKSWSWTASATITDSKIGNDETLQSETMFIRTNYNFGPQTSFHVSWSESTPSGGIDASGFNASFTTAF